MNALRWSFIVVSLLITVGWVVIGMAPGDRDTGALFAFAVAEAHLVFCLVALRRARSADQ